VDKEESQAAQTERFRNGGVRLVRRETVVILWNRCGSCGSMKPSPFADGQTSSVFANAEILPRYRGVTVKSLGDGLMARFEEASDTVNGAAEMHRTLAAQNVGIPEDQQLHLRAGVNVTMAWSNGIDYCGTGVNLAPQLATLAGPGDSS
jgi:adenylate cyclase